MVEDDEVTAGDMENTEAKVEVSTVGAAYAGPDMTRKDVHVEAATGLDVGYNDTYLTAAVDHVPRSNDAVQSVTRKSEI